MLQLEVDLERYRAELRSTRQALPGAYQRLAASAGVQGEAPGRLSGDLDLRQPDYNLDQIRTYVLSIHPDVRAAPIGVERAQLALRRAEVEAIPNVTVGAGYTRQGQNRSNDWDVGVSLPVPVWNRNQGNVLAAKAQISEAMSRVGRIENELARQLATAYANWAAAKERADRGD